MIPERRKTKVVSPGIIPATSWGQFPGHSPGTASPKPGSPAELRHPGRPMPLECGGQSLRQEEAAQEKLWGFAEGAWALPLKWFSHVYEETTWSWEKKHQEAEGQTIPGVRAGLGIVHSHPTVWEDCCNAHGTEWSPHMRTCYWAQSSL